MHVHEARQVAPLVAEDLPDRPVAGPQEMEMSIEKIQFNADIPADKFKIPADVQALIDKKNGTAPKAEQK